MATLRYQTAILFVLVGAVFACPYGQYFRFFTKHLINEFQIIPNPYHKPSQSYLEKVKENMKNKQRVCALKYQGQNKQRYQLKNFNTRADAENQGWIVTHQGICGKCSTTRDLYVYLTTDLTRPVRRCGAFHIFSHENLKKCIKNLGFTDACTQVWAWNTVNSRKQCLSSCIWPTITNQPFVIDGHLNKCLQCDQDISGPIFKYESGRTRRNSGIHSEIDRPEDQIYNVTHCYY